MGTLWFLHLRIASAEYKMHAVQELVFELVTVFRGEGMGNI